MSDSIEVELYIKNCPICNGNHWTWFRLMGVYIGICPYTKKEIYLKYESKLNEN